MGLFSSGDTKQVKLGDKVRDKITGLTGIAIARTEWLQGCARITVQPQELKDGKPVDCSAVDEPQLDIITESNEPKRTTGGPQKDPSKPSAPR